LRGLVGNNGFNWGFDDSTEMFVGFFLVLIRYDKNFLLDFFQSDFINLNKSYWFLNRYSKTIEIAFQQKNSNLFLPLNFPSIRFFFQLVPAIAIE
jgi:hypothetical protein